MPKCKIHPNIDLQEDFRTQEMTYCSACVEDRELEWGLDNPKLALEKWESEKNIASINHRNLEVDRIQRRIRNLKRMR